MDWIDNTLEVDDEGFVTGSTFASINDEHDVHVAISSYEYEQHGELRMNHVPNVVITEKNGRIVAEPYAHDDSDPETAIDNALCLAEHVVDHPDAYVQTTVA